MNFLRLVYFQKFQTVILLVLLASLLALPGCAFRKKNDPFEGINRGVFMLNKTADQLFVKPIARAYDKFLPKPFRYVSHSFFQNLREIPTIANDLLQLKFKDARTAAARFALNTSWGVLGLIDVASLGKIERHVNDFGLTMAHYGYKQSVYLVLPIFGPSTLRDAVGLYVDTYLGVWPYIRPARVGWILYGICLIDTRAKLLQADPIIEEAAIDEYTFMRDAYLQHRRYQMNMDKEPVVGDIKTDDQPNDNEVAAKDSKKPLASDMPDDNELLKKDDKDAKDKDKDKDSKDKDKKSEDDKEADKPKVGAAAVAALQVEDIYAPSNAALGTIKSDTSIGAVLSTVFILRVSSDTTIFMLYVAPGTIPNLSATMPSLIPGMSDFNLGSDDNHNKQVTQDKQDRHDKQGLNNKGIENKSVEDQGTSHKALDNPEEIKGTSTITDAVGGRSK